MKIKIADKFFKGSKGDTDVDPESPPIIEDSKTRAAFGLEYYEFVWFFLWILTLCGLVATVCCPIRVCASILTGLAPDRYGLGFAVFIIAYVAGWVFVYVSHRNKAARN